jgi:transcription elongation factor GreA
MNTTSHTDMQKEWSIHFLTPEGWAKKRARLDYLRTIKRQEVAEYIHEVKTNGNISEISVYEDAKNERAKLEGEIMQLELLLAVTKVMNAGMYVTEVGAPTVRIGMQVEVKSETGAIRTFKLVETFEAEPKLGFISDQSPVGKALLGHKQGDEVSVCAPGGVTTYTICTITSMF